MNILAITRNGSTAIELYKDSVIGGIARACDLHLEGDPNEVFVKVLTPLGVQYFMARNYTIIPGVL